MTYWFYVLLLVLVIQNPNVNASDSDVSIDSYVGGDECKSYHKKSNGSSDTCKWQRNNTPRKGGVLEKMAK